jgi:hypothetical protein
VFWVTAEAAECKAGVNSFSAWSIAGRAGPYARIPPKEEIHVFKKARKRKTIGVVVLLAASAAAFGAYAFTASNTVTAHQAGAGAAAITGYTVTNPQYTWDATGTHVTGATFNLDGPASDVKVALTATPVVADWQDCSGTGALNLVTCTFATPVAVANQVQLSVIAVDTGTAHVA